ncbi:MAG: hypothetical protein HZB53_11050 [Chloroflexi bacterium]|nr:hypothetical protein [Chloroflexota bacterium]
MITGPQSQLLFIGVFAVLFAFCLAFAWLFATVAARIGMPNDDELDELAEAVLNGTPVRAPRVAE